MIENLQGRVATVVQAMDKGRSTAQAGVQSASESGDSLSNINRRVEDIAAKIDG